MFFRLRKSCIPGSAWKSCNIPWVWKFQLFFFFRWQSFGTSSNRMQCVLSLHTAAPCFSAPSPAMDLWRPAFTGSFLHYTERVSNYYWWRRLELTFMEALKPQQIFSFSQVFDFNSCSTKVLCGALSCPFLLCCKEVLQRLTVAAPCFLFFSRMKPVPIS